MTPARKTLKKATVKPATKAGKSPALFSASEVGAAGVAPDPKERAQNLTHNDLTALGARWLRNAGYTAFRECRSSSMEIPDVIGWRHNGISLLIECKRTRADFQKDKAKIFRQYGDMGFGVYRYFLCPAGLLNPSDMPEKWGLLWAYENRIVTKKPGGIFDTTKAAVAEKKVLTALLMKFHIDLTELCIQTRRPIPNRYL